MAVLCALHGERPPAVLRRGTARYTAIVVDYYLYDCGWFDCSSFTAYPRVVTLAALRTAVVFLSVLTPTVLSVRRRQRSRHQRTVALVAKRHELRGLGNMANPNAVGRWVPEEILHEFAHGFMFCEPSSNVSEGRNHRASPPDEICFCFFFGSS